MGEVVINEVAWMGTAESANNEWLELKNNTEAVVELSGWTLKAADGVPAINLAGVIPAGGYFLLERTGDETVPGITADQIYTGALSNSGETLELRDAANNLIDKVDASNGWPAGDNELKLTMERKVNEAGWQSSASAGGTPKAANSGGSPTSPQPSPSEGEGGETQGGGETINLRSDSNEDEAKTKVSDIIISEILPNPVGVDEPGEFIELYNKGRPAVNLAGWKLKNKTATFEFKDSATSTIEGGGYLVLWRPASGLALSNLEDSLSLFSPDKIRALAAVKYKKAPEGQSYARDAGGGWQWTKLVTPGEKNEINHPPLVEIGFPELIKVGQPVIFDASDIVDEDGDELKFSWDFGDGLTNQLKNPEHTFFKSGSYKIKLVVDDGKEQASKTETIKILAVSESNFLNPLKQTQKTRANKKSVVKVNKLPTAKSAVSSGAIAKSGRFEVGGVVSAAPGKLGVQIFYLALNAAAAGKIGLGGIQVYNYYKDFPPLVEGDEVAVTGELTTSAGEPRLKTKTVADVRVIGRQAPPPPTELSPDKIKEEYLGQLVKISGELTDKKNSNLYLDDGSGEIAVYIKSSTGISREEYKEGDQLAVSGIVGKTNSGLRILPRQAEDIVSLGQVAVLGATSPTDEWSLAARDKKAESLKYLLIIFGGLIIVLAGLIVRIKLKNKGGTPPHPE